MSKLLFDFEESLKKLKTYCEKENFKGWDPYDGLNSKIFQATPIKNWDIARLIWIQGFKRSPINFRKLFLVEKQYNSKGIALLIMGYCKLYRADSEVSNSFGPKDELLNTIHKLTKILISMKVSGYSGACWGYNFDWQARRLFLFKKNTPTVVATAFCVEALIESYKITNDRAVLDIALSASEFVMKDLFKTSYRDGHIFSYSIKNGNNTVINASLLGAKILSYSYKYNHNKDHLNSAKKAVLAECSLQEFYGSLVYGLLPIQSWKDSFHTGFNLDAINTYQQNTGDYSFQTNIIKGWDFYIKNFFEKNGIPKYYHNKRYPIDIHSPAQLIITACKLGIFKSQQSILDKTLNWTIKNMQSKDGYFYYQKKKFITSKISYMRWSNAFMFYAISYYFLESQN